jgi:FkbM family methyltransferase
MTRPILKTILQMTLWRIVQKVAFFLSELPREVPFSKQCKRIYYRYVTHLRPEVIYIKGHVMYLDREDALSLSSTGAFEAIETEIVDQEVRAGDTVLDIGANIGYYTLVFAKLVGNTGKVIAFEPDPTNFALLKRNIESNGYRNVKLVRKAVSDRTGTCTLYLSEKDPMDHRIYDFHDGRRSIRVESVRLDDYLKEDVETVDFVKMDIQGAEPAAIKGMVSILERSRNVKILTEFWPTGIKMSGFDPEDYLRWIVEHGFKMHCIDEEKNRLEPISIRQTMKRFASYDKHPGVQNENYTNLLCVRGR